MHFFIFCRKIRNIGAKTIMENVDAGMHFLYFELEFIFLSGLYS